MGLILRAAICLVIVATACAQDEGPDATSGASVLSITERDYSFDVSGEVDAGTLSIRVANRGQELHEIAMAKLVDGKTVQDAREALQAATEEDEDPLAGIADDETPISGLGSAQLPGTSFTITGSGVDPGDYLLLCFIPNAEGRPHHALGMIDGFTVAESEVDEAPEADVTYAATDENLEGPESLPSGETTIEVVNDSSVDREITVMKVKEGSTLEDVGEWFQGADQGPPDPSTAPLDFLAFVFDGEQDRSLTVELTPGRWAVSSSDPEKPFEGPPTEDPHAVLITVE